MEPLSITSSVVGIASLVGQLLQGTRLLYDFWSSVKDVPQSLLWLLDDFAVLRDILEMLESQASKRPLICPTRQGMELLQKCFIYIGNLEELVSPLRSQSTDRGRDRTWKSIKGYFRADKIKRYRENIESAKITLLLGQTYVNQEDNNTKLESLESSIMKLSIIQAENESSRTVDHTATETSIRALEERLQQEVRVMSSEALKELDWKFQHVMVSSLEKSLAEVMKQSVHEYLNSKKMTLKHMSEQPEQVEEIVTPEQLLICKPDRKIKSLKPGSKFRLNQSLQDKAYDLNTLASPQRNCKMCRTGRKFWRKYRTLFGLVIVEYSQFIITSTRLDSVLSISENSHTAKFSFRFIPARWLGYRAVYATTTRPPGFGGNGWKFQIQFPAVVSVISPIFQACKDGDVERIKYLFQTNQARPDDVSDGGETLLMWSLGFDKPCKEVCKLLISCGCDANLPNGRGRYPLDSVLNYCNAWDARAELISEIILDLARFLIEIGKADLWSWELFITNLSFATQFEPKVPQVLQYLCRQEIVDFSSDSLLEDARLNFKKPSKIFHFMHEFPLQVVNTLKVLIDTRFDIRVLGDEDKPFLLSTILVWSRTPFKLAEVQARVFNFVVLEFATMFLNGYDPSIPFHRQGGIVPCEVVQMDPQFTEVAWKLALELSGWGELIKENESTRPIATVEDREDGDVVAASVPGAWPQQPFDGELEVMHPTVREFTSKFDDFDVQIYGTEWDEALQSWRNREKQKRAN